MDDSVLTDVTIAWLYKQKYVEPHKGGWIVDDCWVDNESMRKHAETCASCRTAALRSTQWKAEAGKQLDAAIAASPYWRDRWAEVTEAAVAMLTADVELYRSGVPIYGCVCGESVVGMDGAKAHAHTCATLRYEVDAVSVKLSGHAVGGHGNTPWNRVAWDVWHLPDGREVIVTEDELVYIDGESEDGDYWFPLIALAEVANG